MYSMSARGGSSRLRPGSTGILTVHQKPHVDFSTRLKYALSDFVVAVFGIFDGTGYKGSTIRWSAVVLLTSLTASAAAGAWLCARDLHLRFWLGEVPQLALASLSASLALTLFALCYTDWVHSQRLHQRNLRRHGAKGNLDSPSLLSRRSLRSLFFLLAFFAFSSTGLALLTVHFGHAMASMLGGRCGHSGTTHAIEHTHEKLRVFRNQCHKNHMDRSKPVDQCPGYIDAVPPPAPYATYIKLLEMESGCTGFCKRGHGTLFARPGSASIRSRQTCAAYLGGYIRTVSLVVAVPVIIMGAFLTVVGVALLLYEDL